MALLEKPAVSVQAPIKPEDAKEVVQTGVWGDEAALKLCVQDALRAENFANTKAWIMAWPIAVTLYQSPFTARYWEGTQIERANVPFYTVATAVNSLVPAIVKGMFYDDPPFLAQNRPGTTAQAARAAGAVLNFQLEDIGFKKEITLGARNTVLFGTGIWKWGWETYEKKRKVYQRISEPLRMQSVAAASGSVQIEDEDENIEEVEITEYVDRPSFEHIVNLRHVLVDPGLNVPDIRKAKYVVHRMYMTWEDLEKIRDKPGIDLPTKQELLDLFFPPKEEARAAVAEVSIRNPLWDARAEARFEVTTADPFSQPLEVLERWDNKRYILVLQQKAVLASGENPYGKIPFLSVGWWDVPEAFWSLGLSKTVGSEQRVQQGIQNSWLDNVALSLNGVYTRVMGRSVPTQNIRIFPGKIINVENKDDFNPMKRLDPVPEAGEQMRISQERAEKVSGASEFLLGGVAGASGHSNLGRTASGANLMASGSSSRVEEFIDKLADQVVIPFLYEAHELNCSLLPMRTLKAVLSDELQHEFCTGGGDLLEVVNARVKFGILAAAKMSARRNMAQALPILIQFLESEPIINSLAVEGKKVDTAEIIRMFFEVSDWKNVRDVVVPMTAEDRKRWESSQPGAKGEAQAQAKAGLQQQRFQHQQEIVDQTNIARAGREVLRQAIEQSATPEIVSGEPGGRGFGVGA